MRLGWKKLNLYSWRNRNLSIEINPIQENFLDVSDIQDFIKWIKTEIPINQIFFYLQNLFY